MKIVKKNIIAGIFVFSVLLSGFFAQEEQIDLPDLVTKVETRTEVATESEIPDFSYVIKKSEGSGDIVPQLPEIEIQENTEGFNSVEVSENRIYAEGKLGGGYPSIVYGEFTAYELNKDSPFSVSFFHDSAAGYGKNTLNDGFNDSTTTIEVEKGFGVKNLNFDFQGTYVSNENGLQHKVTEISEMSQNEISAGADVNWQLPKGFSLAAGLDAGFYTRFADITTAATDTLPEWVKQSDTFSFSPEFKFNYNNDSVNVDFLSKYYLDKEFSVCNRGEFLTGFDWKNEYLKVFGDVSLVIGNKLNENGCVFPFTAGLKTNFPVKFADRRMEILAEGGLESYRTPLSDYEKEYKFTAFSFDATETSDWFGNLEIVIPVKKIFTTSFKTHFKTTAFNNGIWEPVYEDSSMVNGIYTYNQIKRNFLETDFSFVLNYKIFALTAGWHSNWLYVPVFESPNMLNFVFSLQNEKGTWNVNLISDFFIQEEFEIPLLALSGMYRITDSVQMIGSAGDIINLVTGKERIYGGKYVSRSGTATLMFKFFF